MFVLSCVGRGLVMSWSLMQGVVPYVCKRLRNQNRRPRPGKGCRATGKKNWRVSGYNIQWQYQSTCTCFAVEKYCHLTVLLFDEFLYFWHPSAHKSNYCILLLFGAYGKWKSHGKASDGRQLKSAGQYITTPPLPQSTSCIFFLLSYLYHFNSSPLPSSCNSSLWDSSICLYNIVITCILNGLWV
jgi:hypothetical protein